MQQDTDTEIHFPLSNREVARKQVTWLEQNSDVQFWDTFHRISDKFHTKMSDSAETRLQSIPFFTAPSTEAL